MENKKEWGETLGELAIKFRWPFVILSLLIAIGLGSGGRFLEMSSDYRYYFGKDNPERLAFEKIQNVYSQNDSVLITITPKNGTVFNKTTLTGIHELTKDSWQVPYSTRVDSITNFQHSKALDDDLIVEDLVLDPSQLTSAKIDEIRTVAINEPLIIDSILNPSSTVTAVNVRVNIPGKSPMEVPEVANYVREMISKWSAKYPEHDVHLSGIAMMNNAFNEAGMQDMMTLTPAMYGLIILIMFVLLRSFSAVVSTFFVLFLSVLSGMGLGGFAGIPITPIASVAPTVIVTLAIADSIHILKSIMGFLSDGMNKKEAIVNGVKVNLGPIFLTSFTTAIGFLSLNFSDTPPFHDLGNMTAMGVMMAFFYSVTFLPAMVAILPLKVKPRSEKSSALERFSFWIEKRKTPALYVTLFLTIFLGAQIPKIQLNDQFVQYFDDSIQFRTDTDYVMENLSGIYQLNFDLSSGESQGISRPDFLAKVDEFSNWFRSIEGVTHVNTITDTFKKLNQNMHGDQTEYYKLPDNRELSAQYLLLYEMSLPYGLDLNDRINVDKSATKVLITMGNITTQRMLEITALGEEWLVKNAPKEMHVKGSSPAVMFSHISKRNVQSMFWGTLLAFTLITICMMIALKNFKYGLISLLPNIIPATFAFGIWSLTVGEAGFAIAVVTSVTLGIVVDDTVHFLSKYVRARREGKSADEAIRYSFKNVGQALVVTSIILTAGFSILMLSSFKMNFVLGALSAMTIAIALIVDFTFLPALLALVDKEDSKEIKGKTMNLKNAVTSFLVAAFAFGASETIFANENWPTTPEERGLYIAKKIDQRDNGFINQVANVQMTLINKQGQKSTRRMRIKTLEVQGDGDKSLTIFDSPRDVKGTAFLSFSHSTTPDDQWLYLPALRRVKRISSNNKSGPFMGSEFAYEDISSQEVDKYTYKYLEAIQIDGQKGHRVERYPVDKNSGYTRQVVEVDEKEWRLQKITFYDRKNSLLKVLTYHGYKKYDNGKWRADKMFVENLQSGKKTELLWSNYSFNQNISSRDFDKNALKRVR